MIYYNRYIYIYKGGAIVDVILWQLDLHLPVQSVPITTEVVSFEFHSCKVYSIQHYVIAFVSDLWQVGSLSGLSDFLHQLKWSAWNNWNIVESGIQHHISNHHL
jgi:hypothetical protein